MVYCTCVEVKEELAEDLFVREKDAEARFDFLLKKNNLKRVPISNVGDFEKLVLRVSSKNKMEEGKRGNDKFHLCTANEQTNLGVATNPESTLIFTLEIEIPEEFDSSPRHQEQVSIASNQKHSPRHLSRFSSVGQLRFVELGARADQSACVHALLEECKQKRNAVMVGVLHPAVMHNGASVEVMRRAERLRRECLAIE